MADGLATDTADTSEKVVESLACEILLLYIERACLHGDRCCRELRRPASV